MLIWIIDEEWTEYDLEKKFLEDTFPGVEIKVSGYDYYDDLEKFGYKADGILAQVYAYLPAKTIEKLEKCKGIATYGGGYDRIDIKACKDNGIKVTNIQGYCAEDLADYTLAAMFNLNKKICMYSSDINNLVKKGSWGALAVDRQVHRLSEQVLLIVGFGTIGKAVSAKAKSIGIKVIAYDEFLSKEEISQYGVEKVGWEEGFKNADYVSVNLKGCDENEDKIGKREFDLMKRDAYIINTSRGRVVNEEDLIEAVNKKIIGGAILDVIKNEPPQPDDPILHCDNILVTPHISYISIESFRLLKEYAIGNLISMIKDEKPRDPVC
ncbi:MAG: C-terminal binding protein [Peptoniphilaceae bacterium]